MINVEKFMKLLIPEPIWRWDNFTNNYDNYLAGDGQWHMIKDKLILKAQDFVKEVFSYEKIEITHPTRIKINRDEGSKPIGKLESENGYCKYTFNVAFGESLYSFKVSNIPVSSDTEQIDAFFSTVLTYLSSAYFSLESNLSHHEQGHLLASHDLMRIADSFVLNFSKTVIIEYLYYVLNIEKNMLEENAWNDHDTNRYNLELLENTFIFANELSSRKIENKEIYTGFVFHNSEHALIDNSTKRIKLETPIEFGRFSQIKNLIFSTNGRDIFFNVTKNKITHIFMTRREVLEISRDPIANGKNFVSRPLILSIQGSGNIFYLQGDIDRNRPLFQIVNSKPIIKDYKFIEKYLFDFLSTKVNGNFDSHFFIKWLFSVPVKKKGTTVVIGNFDRKKLRDKLVHCVEVSTGKIVNHNEESNRALLDHITNPDGAIVFDKTGNILFMSAILPFSQGKKVIGGGARHQSAVNFTKEFQCVAITVSEDGNISVFNNGLLEIKF
ncbi:MAG: hypothetical protein EOM62_11635 [Bacteroidia bacterium]|nr:hypothetical protein [Bacteroidia bacterium]